MKPESSKIKQQSKNIQDTENKCSFCNDLNSLWSTEFFWWSPLSESKHSSVTTKRGEEKKAKKST